MKKRVLVFCWSKELKLWVNFQLFLLTLNSTAKWFSILMLVLSFLEDFWVNLSGKTINSEGKIFQEVQASSVGLKTNFETLECGQFSSVLIFLLLMRILFNLCLISVYHVKWAVTYKSKWALQTLPNYINSSSYIQICLAWLVNFISWWMIKFTCLHYNMIANHVVEPI